MRTLVGVALVTVCLGLAGCSLFGKKQAAHNTNPKPFLGSETPAKAETAAIPRSTAGPLPGANGLIAGRAVAESTGGPIKAYIQVKNLEDEETKIAPLEVETDKAGYFVIAGLKVGGHYKLIARAKEGDKLISQVSFVQPPKNSLFIQLSEQRTTAKTPPIPDAPSTPSTKAAEGPDSSQERTPAASIGAPIEMPRGRAAAPRESRRSVPGHQFRSEY